MSPSPLLLTLAFILGCTASLTSVLPEYAPRFDYVIVGGGTAGLVLADRLSEDPAVSVAVIEAGGSVLNNPNVTSLIGVESGYDPAIDYAYLSAPQVYADNNTLVYHAGKALGGSSVLNGGSRHFPNKQRLEAFATVGLLLLISKSRSSILPRCRRPNRRLRQGRQPRLDVGVAVPVLQEERIPGATFAATTTGGRLVRPQRARLWRPSRHRLEQGAGAQHRLQRPENLLAGIGSALQPGSEHRHAAWLHRLAGDSGRLQ